MGSRSALPVLYHSSSGGPGECGLAGGGRVGDSPEDTGRSVRTCGLTPASASRRCVQRGRSGLFVEYAPENLRLPQTDGWDAGVYHWLSPNWRFRVSRVGGNTMVDVLWAGWIGD